MKLRATQPTPFEARPEQDRVHLPGKFINSPDAAALYDLPGCVERQAVEFAKSVDFVPVLSDITVLQRDVVRPVGSPARSAATRIKALAGHQEFGNARDRAGDPTGLIRRKLADTEAVALGVITAIEPCQGHAVGVLDHVALGIFPDQGPGRLEMAA